MGEVHEQWSRAHGGIDPSGSRWVSGYLTLVGAMAGPLVRLRVPPDAITLSGLLLAASVPALVVPGAGWPLLAVISLVLGALLDGVDGAVARATGGGSAWGEVLDALADRLSELAYLAAALLLGAPVWLCVLVGAVTLLHESVRAVARAAGMRDAGTVTVWERPSRVIVAAFTVGPCGILWLAERASGGWSVDQADVATLGTAAGAVVAVAGFVQLLVLSRRRLGRRARPRSAPRA